MSMLATIAIVTIARDKKTSILQAEKNRLQESISGRASVLQTWLDGQRLVGRRLTNSHVFRLFLTDLSAQDLRLPLPRSLQDQRPYFHQLIADFANQSDLVRATVLRGDGAILLSSPGPKLDVSGLLEKAAELGAGGSILYSPVRSIDDHPSGLVIDAMMTVPRAQEEGGAKREPPAYLVLTLNARPIIETILSHRPSSSEGEEVALYQRRGEAIDQIRMMSNGAEILAEATPDDVEPGMSIVFGRRGSNAPVYSIGEAVEGAGWTLYQALDAKVVLGPLYQFIGVAATVSALMVLLLTLAFSSLWWRLDRDHHVRLVNLYKDHAEEAARQSQFLQAVNRSIGDWLSVTTSDGKIIYANPSFNSVIGRLSASADGRNWNEIVRSLSAESSPQHDVLSVVDGNAFDTIEIGGERYIVSSETSDFWADDGSLQGTVRIIRDHTELVTERRRRLRSLSQTVNAFILAVERRDRFLLGHTNRVRAHAIAVGAHIGLSQNDLATIALAASLSQVGKILIPDAILTKPDRHDLAEEEVMRDHIRHALEILEPIDFDLPVAETLAQMYERLDGSGYPYGLAGNKISMKSRILGVADVYCARTAPRSYRERLSAGKALYHLASNDQRYDLKVVAALADVVGNSQELDDVEIIDQAFIDSAIWQHHRQKERIHQPA
jgi:HD-GYP domain-containing protein (c-di-GMP phosphodiesterase class II)